MLVDNTNAYAQYKQAKGVYGNVDPKAQWWKLVTLYKMRIFIALLIHIGIVGTLHISSYWDKARNVIYKLIEYISFY